MAASFGIAEGRPHVILNMEDADLEHGDSAVITVNMAYRQLSAWKMLPGRSKTDSGPG